MTVIEGMEFVRTMVTAVANGGGAERLPSTVRTHLTLLLLLAMLTVPQRLPPRLPREDSAPMETWVMASALKKTNAAHSMAGVARVNSTVLPQ